MCCPSNLCVHNFRKSLTGDEEPTSSCYALALSRAESICVTTSFSASEGHDDCHGIDGHEDGKLQNGRNDNKDTMDKESCALNGEHHGILNSVRKDKLERLDSGFRVNTLERHERTSTQEKFYTPRESNESNKFTQCGCLHGMARLLRDVRKRKTRYR